MHNLLEKAATESQNLSASPILIVNDSQGRRGIVLDEDSYSIGRSSRCSIRVIDPFVSRFHARLIRVDLGGHHSRFQILDGETGERDSTNGVFLDGQPVKNRMLKLGDTLWLGNQACLVLTSKDALSQEELGNIDFSNDRDALQSPESTEATKAVLQQ